MNDYNPLWKISKKYLDWLQAVEDNDGHIDEELELQLIELEGDVNDALELYYNLTEEIASTIANREKLAKKMLEQNKREQKTIDKIEERADYLVRRFGTMTVNKKSGSKSYSIVTKTLGIKAMLSPSKALIVDESDLDTHREQLMPYLSGSIALKLNDVKKLDALKERLISTGLTEEQVVLTTQLDKTEFKKALEGGLEFDGGTKVEERLNFKFR